MGRRSLLVQVVRASQMAARQAERARIADARMRERQRVQASREAQKAWVEDMQDEADSMTNELLQQFREIDNVLAATLQKDDYFELETLRKNVAHPEFNTIYGVPESEPSSGWRPVEPVMKNNLLISLFGWALSKGLADKVRARSLTKHAGRLDEWKEKIAQIEAEDKSRFDAWSLREKTRLERLSESQAKYKAECLEREIEIQKANAELDVVIAGLPRGKKDAVETYVDLVFSESEFPAGLEPSYDVSFDEVSRELMVSLQLPSPSLFPDAAGYRFQKSSGEIIEKKQTQRDAKVRFEKFVGDAVVRTLHEVFEADRDSVIRLISLQAYVEHISSSTGKQTETVLAEVSTDRNRFLELDLRNVVALEAMLHLGAIVSKNMWGLTPIPTGKSIRRI